MARIEDVAEWLQKNIPDFRGNVLTDVLDRIPGWNNLSLDALHDKIVAAATVAAEQDQAAPGTGECQPREDADRTGPERSAPVSSCFEARVFSFPKDPENPSQYEDAWHYDPGRGIAAIADGVSSSIFSRPWAEILVHAAEALSEPNDKARLVGWLREQRDAWSRAIDVGDLKWFQKAKLAKGAFSTLLCVHVSPCDPSASPAQVPGAFRLRGFAIGDSCLFHVRSQNLIRAFPIQRSDCFQADPMVLGSIDVNRDEGLHFATFDDLCYADDLLILCTDALAEYILQRKEAGDQPRWDDFWKLSDQQWRDAILAHREGRQIRIDDTTFILLQIRVSPREAKENSSPATAPASLAPTVSPVQPDAGTKEPAANPPSGPAAVRKASPSQGGHGQPSGTSHLPSLRTHPPLPPPLPRLPPPPLTSTTSNKQARTNGKKLSVPVVVAVGGGAMVVLLLVAVVAAVMSRSSSLQGTWKVNSPSAATERVALAAASNNLSFLLNPLVAVEVEFRSDGSITSELGKAEGLTWHGDYICLNADIKKIRDARTDQLTRERKAMVSNASNAELQKKSWLAYIARAKNDKETAKHPIFWEDDKETGKKPIFWEDLEKRIKKSDEELEKKLKAIDQQLEDLKNGKVMEGDAYFPWATGVDKKDISESADKVEVRIHWVDADHFDLGSNSFSRVKLPK